MRRCLNVTFLSCCIALAAMAILAPPAEAYPTYSEGKVTNPDGSQEAFGNCKTCHGHFRATNEENGTPYLRDEYISPKDGRTWNEIFTSADPGSVPEEEIGLHDIHRHVMLDEDHPDASGCDVCHSDQRPNGGSTRYPVVLDYSATAWFGDGIGCVGCHGRLDDVGNDNQSEGYGAGLRQHHTNAGVNECKTCHEDANPAKYIPVGEDVLPPYYAAPYPDDAFLNKPTDPCSPHGEEDYAGSGKGLDNDGDGRYDKADSDCTPRGSGRNHDRR